MPDNYLANLLLSLISASGYVAAAYFMKLFDRLGAVPVVALIAGALAVAVICELIVLKHARMGQVYFVILGMECVLVAVFARLALGESYSANELIGIAVIIAGIAIFQIPNGQPDMRVLKTGTDPKRGAGGGAEQPPGNVRPALTHCRQDSTVNGGQAANRIRPHSK